MIKCALLVNLKGMNKCSLYTSSRNLEYSLHIPGNSYSCDSSPCFHGSTCLNTGDNFSCICPAGFEGRTCQINIDNCNNNPWYV